MAKVRPEPGLIVIDDEGRDKPDSDIPMYGTHNILISLERGSEENGTI